MTIQALRFPKEDDWTMESAKAWVKEHPDVGHSASVDDTHWSIIPELDGALRKGLAMKVDRPDSLHRVYKALDGFNAALRQK
jgi:hypothetical protein